MKAQVFCFGATTMQCVELKYGDGNFLPCTVACVSRMKAIRERPFLIISKGRAAANGRPHCGHRPCIQELCRPLLDFRTRSR